MLLAHNLVECLGAMTASDHRVRFVAASGGAIESNRIRCWWPALRQFILRRIAVHNPNPGRKGVSKPISIWPSFDRCISHRAELSIGTFWTFLRELATVCASGRCRQLPGRDPAGAACRRLLAGVPAPAAQRWPVSRSRGGSRLGAGLRDLGQLVSGRDTARASPACGRRHIGCHRASAFLDRFSMRIAIRHLGHPVRNVRPVTVPAHGGPAFAGVACTGGTRALTASQAGVARYSNAWL